MSLNPPGTSFSLNKHYQSTSDASLNTVPFTADKVWPCHKLFTNTAQLQSVTAELLIYCHRTSRAPEFRFDHVCRVHTRELFCTFRYLTTIPRSSWTCPTSTKNQIHIQATFSWIFPPSFLGVDVLNLDPSLHYESCYIMKPTKITHSSLRQKKSIMYFICIFFLIYSAADVLWIAGNKDRCKSA